MGKINRVLNTPVKVIADDKRNTSPETLTYTFSKPLADSIWQRLNDEKIVAPIPNALTWAAADSITMIDTAHVDTLAMKKLTQHLNADGYIDVIIAYAHSIGPLKEPSAWCILALHESKTGNLVMTCEFDTHLEKDYWFGPAKLEQVTRDAIKGVVQKFCKTVSKNRPMTSK